MRIAVYGAGAVGGYFGARLSAAGHDVTFIARGAHLDAIRRDGLRISSVHAAGDLVCRAPATDDPATVGVVDLVLVAVKAWQIDAIAPKLRSLVGPSTAVVPLQNGVETVGRLRAALGDEPVLGGLCRIMSALAAPGQIRHTAADPAIVLGELAGESGDRAGRLREALDVAGVTVEVAGDITTEIWRKFLLIEPWGAVGAATRVPIGTLRRLPQTRALLERALAEVAALATANGAALGADAVGRMLAVLDALPAAGIPSMQRDLVAGRPSEVEDQLGAVVRLGVAHDVATPVHDVLYACLRPQELAARRRRSS